MRRHSLRGEARRCRKSGAAPPHLNHLRLPPSTLSSTLECSLTLADATEWMSNLAEAEEGQVLRDFDLGSCYFLGFVFAGVRH